MILDKDGRAIKLEPKPTDDSSGLSEEQIQVNIELNQETFARLNHALMAASAALNKIVTENVGNEKKKEIAAEALSTIIKTLEG